MLQTVNAELSGFVSLVSDPTMLPTMQGLGSACSKRPQLLSTLAIALTWIVALASRS